jgi:hypothetical protein
MGFCAMSEGRRSAGMAGLGILVALVAAASGPSLPPRLEDALNRKDPLALADTTLPRLAQLDSAQRAVLADRMGSWEIGRRVAAFAFLQVGTPYRLGPLGEGAPPDSDPVFEVENHRLRRAQSGLGRARARARGGRRARGDGARRLPRRVISYATRLHFTTDRLDESPYYRDITQRVAGSSCKSQRVTLNQAGERQAMDRHRLVAAATRLVRAARLERALRRMAPRRPTPRRHRGRVREDDPCSATASTSLHESLLWKGRTLLHASSVTGRVVTIPWESYLAGPGKGIRRLRALRVPLS